MLGKRSVFLAAAFFLILRLSASPFEEKYGIGTVRVTPYNFFSLAFYSQRGDADVYDQVNFTEDRKTNALHFQFASAGIDTLPGWFMPEYFSTSMEKNRIEFFCLEKEGTWCRVLVNRNTGTSKWLQLGIDVVFEDWSGYFTSAASVSITAGDPFLYKKPSAGSKHETIRSGSESNGTQLIRTRQVQGEWLLVDVITFGPDNKETGKSTGWIRWHDDEKMLVTCNFFLD